MEKINANAHTLGVSKIGVNEENVFKSMFYGENA